MPAVFKDHDEQYFTYKDSKEIKVKGNQYVVYDGYGNVLGVHLVEAVEMMTTDAARIPVVD